MKNNILSNFTWRFLERFGAQGITLVVSIILTRLLDPAIYGTVALVTVFTTIMQVFVDSGMGNALIQKKDTDDLDFSTVFYYNIIVCFIIYIIMFFSAPFIASFYNTPELTKIIRILSITLIISGVKNIQQAYVSRNMMFKRFFFATLGGTVGAAIVGIFLAYKGFGVWALVAQYLFNNTVDTLILWITVKWRPKLMFSFERLKSLFSYGWKLLVSGLIDTIYNNLRQLIIGKLYTKSDLAYFNKGKQLPSLIVTNVNVSIDSVLLPIMSAVQDDESQVRSITKKAIKTGIYITAPLMLGFAAIADPFVRLVLTEKWISAVPFLRIFCINYIIFPIQAANLNAVKALGRSDTFLKFEIAKKIAELTVLLTTMWFGVMAMTYSMIAASIISYLISTWPVRKLLHYGYIDQLKDILPSILLSVFMSIAVWIVGLLNLNVGLTLILQISLGFIIYILGSIIFKFEVFLHLLDILKNKNLQK